MAAGQLSTAIKEEWSLTEEQVALIEASTALSDKPDDVGTLAAGAVALNTYFITIFVPTPTLLGRAQKIVADWGIPEPSKEELHGGVIHPGLSAPEIFDALFEVIRQIKENPGLAATAIKLQQFVLNFVIQCVKNPGADAYEVWDVISKNDDVLHLGKDGVPPTPREPENFVCGQNDTYGQIQLALAYYPLRRNFVCAYSFAYRSKDERTDAIKTSWTPQRTNSIRILFANLMAHYIKAKIPELVNLVQSDKPYPVLGKVVAEECSRQACTNA
jgi:hypothetical protein